MSDFTTTKRLAELSAAKRDLRRSISAMAGSSRAELAEEIAAIETEVEELVGHPQPRSSLSKPSPWAKHIERHNARLAT